MTARADVEEQPWVTGPAFEMMVFLSGNKHRPGVFREGDELMLRDGRVGTLVERALEGGPSLRVVVADLELWGFWGHAVGWRRPSAQKKK